MVNDMRNSRIGVIAVGASACVLAGIAVHGAPPVRAPSAPEVATARTGFPKQTDPLQEFRVLVAQYEHWRDHAFPESALSQGRPTYADRITDPSLAAIEVRLEQTKVFLSKLAAISAQALPDKERLEYALLKRDLQEGVDGHRFRGFLMPISGRGGPQQDIPQMAENMPFATATDYANYIKRLQAVPQAIRDVRELMKLGVKEGRVPPKATMTELPAQFEAVIMGKLEPLRAPFARMPASITPPERQLLIAQFEPVLAPILAELGATRTYLVEEYLPACRDNVGVSNLPDGAAWYDFALRAHTTTEMNAKQIHETGLAEVARIRAEMLTVIRKTDWFKDDAERSKLADDQLFAEFLKFLRTDARFYCKTADELLAKYRDICKQIDAKLPALFGTLPRSPYGVREIPRFMAPTQTTAYYQPGSLRAGNPGWFYANTYALDQRPSYEMIPLSLHEAVPGHHLQISIAQELPDQPEFRRQMGTTAFVEGWALYAERLGIEMGFYDHDPYADFGRLLYEMWRATRLVVDTGIHAFGWSRQQAIDYMKANTALSELNITREVDRYIDWPGQATGYKIGELRIRAIRERAEKALGGAFDIRAFHDMILGSGSLPLEVLELQANDWIAKRAGGR